MLTPSELDAAIRAQIDRFLGSISSMVRKAAVESVRAVLEDGAAPARRGPGRKRRAKRARRARKVARGAARGSRGGRPPLPVDEKTTQALVTYVRAHPGERLEQIGRALKRPTEPLKRPIARLVATGAMRTKGQRRGTMYFLSGRGGNAAAATKARGAKKARRRGRKAGKRGRRKAA